MAQETQIVPYVPWTLALRKEKLQFEEAFAEGAYCALIKRLLQRRLVKEIVELLKTTQSKPRKSPKNTETNPIFCL